MYDLDFHEAVDKSILVGSESPCPAELATYIVYFFNIILCGDFSKINFI